MTNIKVGIIGGAGYTGGELLRILIHHPNVTIVYVNSKSQIGKPVSDTHLDLLGDTDLKFSNDLHTEIDVVFLCSGHGESAKFLANNPNFLNIKIIDLSTDFRDQSQGFVYGLPELQQEKIAKANYIANPGCFATSIELALLPLAQNQLLQQDVHISAITGSTGAGQSLSASTHFSWRNNNVSIYKAFEHQHLTEIGMVVNHLQSGFDKSYNFIPYRGNFTRGIMANVYTSFQGTLQQAIAIYESYYQNHPFVTISAEQAIDLKQVVNTNKCLLQLTLKNGNLLITSVIDNLTKGASGQAVQNMNILFGLDQKTGLRLKSVGF
ncbi:MAG: N-acetyl-gamma-glutamyl-phosphate reductase [Pseudarcicella sp.]|nr:N-acetyl-gamma-glutamyl-phosphate reductase [Pseudarcicella sp.]MBP6409475.1 N-acetyl-gamma-glutamyl-phosphate reductase [Pseudarcicella sp.]